MASMAIHFFQQQGSCLQQLNRLRKSNEQNGQRTVMAMLYEADSASAHLSTYDYGRKNVVDTMMSRLSALFHILVYKATGMCFCA